jgi:hypothetical protein
VTLLQATRKEVKEMSITTVSLRGPVEQPSREDGRSTPPGTPTNRKVAGMRRRTELGYLLFLQYQAKLTPGQWAYLLGLQRRVNSEELDSSIQLFGKLTKSPRAVARAHEDLRKILARTPHLSPKSIRREQRRIGVGYRDKGTLRLPSEDHQAPPRTWWWEDIAQILHLSGAWMISEQLLAEEDLAKGDILDTSNQKVASLVVFTTKAGSKISCIKWRSPETTLISQKTESS